MKSPIKSKVIIPHQPEEQLQGFWETPENLAPPVKSMLK